MHLQTRPRHVVVLCIDSLRDDSMHGDDGPHLPYVEQHGVRFTEARAGACWTGASHASMFSGQFPHEHGCEARAKRVLSDDVPLLAELMKSIGYRTAMVTANGTSTGFGLPRGFDEVRRMWQIVPIERRISLLFGMLVSLGKPRLREAVKRDFMLLQSSEDIRCTKGWIQSLCEPTFNEVRRIVAESDGANTNAFVFANVMEAHAPYHVWETFWFAANGCVDSIRELMAIYNLFNQTWLITGHQPIAEDMLALLKQRQRTAYVRIAPHVNALVEELHRRGDTTVVVLSDHGDCFGENRAVYHFGNIEEAGWRVPFYWLPHGQDTRHVITEPVNLKDLFHGILKEVGHPRGEFHPVDAPERSEPVQESFWYNNQGKTLSRFQHDQFAFVTGKHRWVLRKGHWRYSDREGNDFSPHQFVTTFDPIEEVVSDPKERARLRQRLNGFLAFSAQHGA